MEFKTVFPEEKGIRSEYIFQFLHALETANLSTHSVLIARGNDIIFEKYYPPFTPDFLHREYSQTKSIVGIAVLFAIHDGLVNLDAPIQTYFPAECCNLSDPLMGEQTVRQMLMMSTPKHIKGWFHFRPDDRVKFYFQNITTRAPLGSGFCYDSDGSFILGALVERVTGLALIDYLRVKLFDELGISHGVRFLKCPGGHAWGDSGLLATPRDMAKIVRFILDKGCVNGKQLLPPAYLEDALTHHMSTSYNAPDYNSFGYGYQIWKTFDGGFSFNGMGGQFSVGVPDKDLILIINSDNQGLFPKKHGKPIFDAFFEYIVHNATDTLPENPTEYAKLTEYADSLTLFCEKGAKHSVTETAIDGVTFIADENPMGIRWFRLFFAAKRGILEYENAQGLKSLSFGLCANSFTVFPEEGYSREVGAEAAPGNYYRCASSAAWKDEKHLHIDVQIIDEYFGRLHMLFAFDGSTVSLEMKKTAEDFLTTYNGTLTAHPLL